MTERLIEICYSDNGSRDWTNWRARSLGVGAGDSPVSGSPLVPAPDQAIERAIFRRLGMAINRSWRIRVSSPVKVDLLSASVQVDG